MIDRKNFKLSVIIPCYNEKNTITITEDTFQLSNKTKIKGDEDDKIILPDNALQINSDDLYLYYTLNDIEIGVSVDLIII